MDIVMAILVNVAGDGSRWLVPELHAESVREMPAPECAGNVTMLREQVSGKVRKLR